MAIRVSTPVSFLGPWLTLSTTIRQHNHACRQQSAINLKIIFEAAWAVTNLAAGPQQCVEAILPAAPLLILLLRTNSSSHIAEQSAWALGKSIVQCLVRLRLLGKAEAPPTCIINAVSKTAKRPDQQHEAN